jgi:DNA-binding transcriptional ArsR family regulator
VASDCEPYNAIFAALGHPSRRTILVALNNARGPLTSGKIARLLGAPWATTSQHLQLLEEAGLVSHQRKGRNRLYRLELDYLALARNWVDRADSRSNRIGPDLSAE